MRSRWGSPGPGREAAVRGVCLAWGWSSRRITPLFEPCWPWWNVYVLSRVSLIRSENALVKHLPDVSAAPYTHGGLPPGHPARQDPKESSGVWSGRDFVRSWPWSCGLSDKCQSEKNRKQQVQRP